MVILQYLSQLNSWKWPFSIKTKWNAVIDIKQPKVTASYENNTGSRKYLSPDHIVMNIRRQMHPGYIEYIRSIYGIYHSVMYINGTKCLSFALTTFSIAFQWINNFVFQFEFHWSLFLRFQLTISEHLFYLNQYWPSLLTHICGTRGRWVKTTELIKMKWNFLSVWHFVLIF